VAACLSARVLSRCPDPARASRPFDRDRDGFVLSEGSAALVLEELGHARRRGAPAYAELLGGCQTSSIAGFTVNDADDCAACIRRALARAGVEPDGIDLVSAHAPSTPLGDRQEAEALNAVFNGRRVPVFAAKSSLGHSMAATAALESIASVLAIRDGVAPPTLHYEVPDPECDVDCIPGSARRLPVRRVLKNAFGFGGVNCSLVFGAPADA
jgi:3-oxoacyl-[acyl-carrier-protein] synthase II